MRLFVALLPDEAAREALVTTQDAIGPLLAKGRRTAPGNLHLTLVFIGEVDEEGRQQVERALAGVRMDDIPCPVELHLGRVGAFRKRRDSILWRGIEEDGQLTAIRTLNARITRALADAGHPVDEHFTPHVTLFRSARVAEDAQLEELPVPGSPWIATAFHLMLSHHPEGGALTYTSLREFQLR